MVKCINCGEKIPFNKLTYHNMNQCDYNPLFRNSCRYCGIITHGLKKHEDFCKKNISLDNQLSNKQK